jgi:hypothetical protein
VKTIRTKSILKLAALFLPAAFALWYVTAPAGMALQRISSGGNGGPFARVVCAATDWYESPMAILDRNPTSRRASDWLADAWCEILAAPETTP